MLVMKFGGTSVGSAGAIERLRDIVRSRLGERLVVVVSAMAGATNRLLECARWAAQGDAARVHNLLQELIAQHRDAAQAIFDNEMLERLQPQLNSYFIELRTLLDAVCALRELTPRSSDAIAAYGERLSSLLVANCLTAGAITAQLMDARDFIITDDRFMNAAPIIAELEPRCRAVLMPVIEAGSVPVIQGFIGATKNGVTTTIGRGGSDYTAALVGAALAAKSIEIWTDVDGLLTGDPRILSDVKKLKVIGFNEAAELAYFGAKVLHPATVLPAIKNNIPVYILNSMKPIGSGTRIISASPPSRNVIKAIACRRGITVINITSTRMLMAHGFLRAIFELFDKHQTAVDVVSTSEVSVSLTLDNTDKLKAIIEDLSSIGEVNVATGRAIICVVGADLKSTPGIAGRLFKCIEHVNIDMISQGASHINITLVVAEADLSAAAQALHAEFFQDLDEEVFE